MQLKCPDCSRVFKYSKNLKYHILNNTCKDKVHECQKCNLKYKLKSSLKKHMKLKHTDKVKIIDLPICITEINKIDQNTEEFFECIYCEKKIF